MAKGTGDGFLGSQINILKGTNAPPPATEPIVISEKSLTRYVALVAFLLPTLLLIGSSTRRVCFYDSISHFYFAPVWGGFFVGCLGFIALFLCAFRGNGGTADFWMSLIAGFAAAGVALFPTAGAGCVYDGTEVGRFFAQPMGSDEATWDKIAITTDFTVVAGIASQTLHKWCATVLFGILAWFCLVSFRRNNGTGVQGTGPSAKKSPQKLRRNRVYWFCGLGILGCIAYMGWTLSKATGNAQEIFVPEALALYLFAFSWLVKSKLIKWFDG